MQKLASALLLGCLTTLALAWLVAAFMPVPMYPRRIFRVWLGENNLPASSTEVHALPLLPIWPRVLGNIVFWSLVWWLVPTALIAWRRQRRSRRGVCQGCGYDLVGTAVGEDTQTTCPECGAVWKLGPHEPKNHEQRDA